MRRFVAVISLVLLAAVAGPAGAPAHAVVPGNNGKIVYARATWTSFLRYDIVVANADGSNPKVVAGPYPQDAFDDHFIANWSPDGSNLIFMANQVIWKVNANGSDLHPIFAPPEGTGVDDGPTYTPDGQHIVFTRCCPEGFGYSLWMIDADGTDLTNITTEPQVNGDGPAETSPQVSPDGTRIAFNRCFPDAPCVIATVGIHGHNLQELTENTSYEANHPNWSPDSRWIVFQMHYFGGGADIARIRPDGTGFKQLTFYGEAARNGAFDPCFSPEGTRILFSKFVSTGGNDLYTMSPNGTDVSQVTRTASLEFSPQWAAR